MQRRSPSLVRPVVLRERDAAVYVGMSAHWLHACRAGRATDGPAYLRAGRSVRYRIADLDAWLASRVVGGRPPAGSPRGMER
jgi:hypothetical protein